MNTVSFTGALLIGLQCSIKVAEDLDFCLKIGLVIPDLTFGIFTTPFPFFNALVTYNALYVFRVSVFYLQ